jgi:AcrR family transcriptional regulator
MGVSVREIGGEHGKHHRHRQRCEEIARSALQEEHGNEHTADRERGNQCRDSNTGGTLQYRLVEFCFFFQKAVGILYRDRAVVDQYADRQCKTAKSHCVDRLPECREHRDGRHDRQWNCHYDDEHRPPGTKEYQHHQSGQASRDRAFLQHALDGVADEYGLIEQQIDFHAGWCRSPNFRQCRLDLVDYVKSRGIPVLDDGGKQGLFEAIISVNCETIFRGLTPEQLAPREPHEVLRQVGVRYLAIVTSAACLNLNRLVIAEAPRIPELAERFWKLGPGRSRAFLTEFFDRQIERGVLRMQDSSTAADHFLDMLSGTPRLQCLIGVREPPGPPEIDLMVEAAVTQFLDGCLVK